MSINLLAKKEKELESIIHTIRIYSQDLGMEFFIEKYAMLMIKSGKWQMTEGIEQTNQEIIRKGNLYVLGNIGSWHYPMSGDEKNEERVSQTKEKTSGNQALQQESHQRDKHMDERRTQTNELEDKKTNDDAQGLTSDRWHRQTIKVKKRMRKRIRQHWR